MPAAAARRRPSPPAPTCATSPSSPTSTTARPRSSTRCCARPARSGPTRRVVDRVMDSGDLEREKGITILAKQTTVDHGGVRLNIVDTPGPRRLRRRGRALAADGRLGAAPRRRRRGAAAADPLRPPEGDGPPPAGGRGDQQDRPRRRPPGRRSSTTSTSCSSTSAPTSTRSSSRSSTRTPSSGRPRATWPSPGTDLRPLLDLLVEVTPPPTYTPDHPLQLLVTNLSANDYVGRMAVGRIWNGTIRTGQRIAVVREEADDTAGSVEPGRTVTLSGTVTSLQTAHGIDRVDIEEAGPGDIVSVAGLPEVTIGDTLTDPADPRPLPRLDVDAPTLRMTFGVNTSPLAGREGKYVTSRQIKARLEKRGPRQRLDRGPPVRVERGVRGPRPRRAPAGRPHRADAPRGLRADRLTTGGAPARGRRRRSRSRTSGSRSTSRPTTSARSRRRWPAARAASSRCRPTPTGASGWSSCCRSAG